jgi:hypothetical protein
VKDLVRSRQECLALELLRRPTNREEDISKRPS